MRSLPRSRRIIPSTHVLALWVGLAACSNTVPSDTTATLTSAELVDILQADAKVAAVRAALASMGCVIDFAADDTQVTAHPEVGFTGIYLREVECDDSSTIEARLVVGLGPDAQVVVVGGAAGVPEGDDATLTSVVAFTVDGADSFEEHDSLAAFEIAWRRIIEESYPALLNMSTAELVAASHPGQRELTRGTADLLPSPVFDSEGSQAAESLDYCGGSCLQCMGTHATEVQKEKIATCEKGTGTAAVAGGFLFLGCVAGTLGACAPLAVLVGGAALVGGGAAALHGCEEWREAPTPSQYDQEFCWLSCGDSVCTEPCYPDRIFDDGCDEGQNCTQTDGLWVCEADPS